MTDDPRQATELETLKAVLDECGKRKLTIGAISVGSIRLVLAIPLSEPMPSTPAKRLTAEEEELPAYVGPDGRRYQAARLMRVRNWS